MSNQQSQNNAAMFVKDIKILRLENAWIADDIRDIRDALADGWVLYGELMIHPNGDFVQQMVKYDQRLMDVADMSMDMVIQQLNQFR